MSVGNQLTVAEFDALPVPDASSQLAPCCASRRWISEVVDARPYATLEVLTASSDQVLAGVSWSDVLEALQAHPRIGARSTGTDRESTQESRWSRAEQAGTATVEDQTRNELLEGNTAYEEKFGFVFLICATGLSAQEMVQSLKTRHLNTDQAEREVVRDELRKIVSLRLAKSFSPDDETIAM